MNTPRWIHLGVFIAFALVPVVWWLLWRSTLGFEIRTVGANPDAARYAGMRPAFLTILTMSLCGLLAGLAGAGQILGVSGFMTASYGTSIGFDAISVALLGRAHPVGIMLAALLFGAMRAGSGLMQIQAGIPVEIIDVIQATILLFLAADVLIRRILLHPGAGRGADRAPDRHEELRQRDAHLMEIVYGIPILGVIFQFIGYVIDVTPGIAPIVLGLAAPIALGALCGVMNERSGIVNIGIEGMMLSAAFAGFLAAGLWHQAFPVDPWAGPFAATPALLIGIVAAILTAMALSALHMAVDLDRRRPDHQRRDHQRRRHRPDRLPQPPADQPEPAHRSRLVRDLPPAAGGRRHPGDRLDPRDVHRAGTDRDERDHLRAGPPGPAVPLALGPADACGGRASARRGHRRHRRHPPALPERDRGRHLRRAGRRYLTLEGTGSFQNGMTAGRGFIALAAVIFGRWTPIGAFAGALLFAYSGAFGQAVRIRPPGDEYPDLGAIMAAVPSQVYGALPYIVTIVILAGVVGGSIAPAAVGRPYVKEGQS